MLTQITDDGEFVRPGLIDQCRDKSSGLAGDNADDRDCDTSNLRRRQMIFYHNALDQPSQNRDGSIVFKIFVRLLAQLIDCDRCVSGMRSRIAVRRLTPLGVEQDKACVIQADGDQIRNECCGDGKGVFGGKLKQVRTLSAALGRRTLARWQNKPAREKLIDDLGDGGLAQTCTLGDIPDGECVGGAEHGEHDVQIAAAYITLSMPSEFPFSHGRISYISYLTIF